MFSSLLFLSPTCYARLPTSSCISYLLKAPQISYILKTPWIIVKLPPTCLFARRHEDLGYLVEQLLHPILSFIIATPLDRLGGHVHPQYSCASRRKRRNDRHHLYSMPYK